MWGREMRAGLVFVLVSLLAGSAFRDWKRAHESRFEEIVADLELRDAAARRAPAGPGAPNPDEGAPDSSSSRPARGGRGPALAPSRIDLDRASAPELERLPGIGPALAERIVHDRAARGPFGAPEALLRVRGIGPKTLERIRPYLMAPAGASGAADSGSPIAN